MSRVEQRLKTSPQRMQNPELVKLVEDMTCRIGGAVCQDVRPYVVRNPGWNANMAPNGMLQIWTGLILRMSNEDQLAAVIGHEIAHYQRRHGIEKMRAARDRTDVGAFFGIGFGVAGLSVQLALIASLFSYNRDQEREADEIGLELATKAGYRAIEASRVWENLIDELAKADVKSESSPMFATHPPSEERSANLRALASARPGTSRAEPDRLSAALKKLRGELLADELRLRQYGQTEIMLTRRIKETGGDGWLHFALGEVYRLRDQEGDPTRALDQYARARNDAEVPAEAHRGEGLVRRRMGDHASASDAFRRYLDAAPNAPDRAVIQPYVL